MQYNLNSNLCLYQNPSPDVICSLRPLLPNSEVTSEHHLLPLPTASGAPHPQPKIDRQVRK